MQREIYFANLDPAKGAEQQGVRPVLIISGDAMNEMTDLCIVCPLSTKIKKYPGSVILAKNQQNGLTDDSEVLTFQIRILSKQRLIRKVGTVSVEELARVKSGLLDVLTF
jgi:mRNA interferase MazF